MIPTKCSDYLHDPVDTTIFQRTLPGVTGKSPWETSISPLKTKDNGHELEWQQQMQRDDRNEGRNVNNNAHELASLPNQIGA